MQTDSINKPVSITFSFFFFTVPARASDHFEGSYRLGKQQVLAVTFRQLLTSKLKETVAGSTQEGAVVAGKSNTSMLAFQEYLSLGCPARYVYGSCLCSLRKQAGWDLVAVMNSTYVCVCLRRSSNCHR